MYKYRIKIRTVLSVVLLFAFSQASPAQSKPDPAKIAPPEALNIKKTVAPIPHSMVRVSLNCDLVESTACQKDSKSGRLSIELSWYNKNDEAGSMMLQLIDNKPDFEQQWATHKKEIRFEYDHYKIPGNSLYCSGILEENVPGGKLYMVHYSYAYCDSETAKQFTTDARCFFFNGTMTGAIEIRSQNSVEEIRKMVARIIRQSSEFAFSALL